MFLICVSRRAVQWNIMYTVPKAVMPAICVVVYALILVMYVIRHSGKRLPLQDIKSYILESALILAIFVIRHSVIPAIL